MSALDPTNYSALNDVASTAAASAPLVISKHNPLDASGGNRSYSLPTGAPAGTMLSAERVDSAQANTCTITGSIRGVGSSSLTLLAPNANTASQETVLFMADASGSWWPVAGHKTKSWLDAQYKRVFHVDAYSSPAVALAALVTFGGGELHFTDGSTYTFTASLSFTTRVPLQVTGWATIVPPSTAPAFIFNAGRSSSATMRLGEGLTIDGTTVGGAAGTAIGVEVVDHYGVVIDANIQNCGTGLLITDSTGWSESSNIPNVYVTNCGIGIDFETTGGTGSFGYSNWGLIHVDHVPASGIGIKIGAGASVSVGSIARLIVHTSANSAKGMYLAGNFGVGSILNAVFECQGTPTSTIAVDIAGTGSAYNSRLHVTYIGAWGKTLNNPANRPWVPIPNQPGIKSGDYYFANSAGAVGTSGAPAVTIPKVSQAEIPCPIMISAVGIEFTAAGSADSVVRLGVWDCDSGGWPNNMVQDFGIISTGTGNAGSVATGGTPGTYMITLGTPFLLLPGQFVGAVTQGTTPATLKCVSPAALRPPSPYYAGTSVPSAGVVISGYSSPNTYTGALGSTFGTPAPTSSNVPRIILRAN